MFRTIATLATIAAIIVAFIWAIFIGLPAYGCHSKWRDSGLDSQYGFFAGCRVQTPDGRWLPAERVREIEITPKVAK